MLKTLVSILVIAASQLASAQDAVPKHLQIARQIVDTVKPENNTYTNDKRYIRMPGDLFAKEVVVKTDCSGFVEEVFRRAGAPLTSDFTSKQSKGRYLLADYLVGFTKEQGVKLIHKVEDIRPGDVIIWKFFKPSTKHVGHTYNGHVMLVDSIPVQSGEDVKRKKAAGLVAWNVKILDTTQNPKSEDDTRYRPNSGAEDDDTEGAVKDNTGAGRGTIRLFSDAQGKLAAVSFGFKKPNVHINSADDWLIYVGRKTY